MLLRISKWCIKLALFTPLIVTPLFVGATFAFPANGFFPFISLKAIYFRADDHPKAVAAIDRLLLLSPAATIELRDRGAIYLQMEAFRLALADFELYLATNPPSAEREPIMEAVHDLRRRVALLN